jgi:hypothetical protein
MASNEATPCRWTTHQHAWQTLIEFELSAEPGSERLAVNRVVQAMQKLNWPAAHLEQLKAALAEAARKAMESNRRYDSDRVLFIRVLIPENDPAPQEADPANDEPAEHQVADRQAQQDGRPPSRGWSFFLIERAAPSSDRAGRHLLELFLYPEGDKHNPHGC